MLLRTGSKGQFVLWPKEWGKRFYGPRNRRYQTACDMLVGQCACGRYHSEQDEDTENWLNDQCNYIESLYEWRRRTSQERAAT